MQSPSTNDAAKDPGSKSDEAVAFGKAKRRPAAANKGPETSSKPKINRAPEQIAAHAVKPAPKRMAPKKTAPVPPSSPLEEAMATAPLPAKANKSPYRWDTRFTIALIILVVGINLTLTLLFGRHDDVSSNAEAVAGLAAPETIPAPVMNLPSSEDAPGLTQAPLFARDDDNGGEAADAMPADASPPAVAPGVADEATQMQAATASAPNAALLDRLNAVEPSAAAPPLAPKPAAPAIDTRKLLEIINQY